MLAALVAAAAEAGTAASTAPKSVVGPHTPEWIVYMLIAVTLLEAVVIFWLVFLRGPSAPEGPRPTP